MFKGIEVIHTLYLLFFGIMRLMNKRLVHLIVLVSLFCVASSAFAVTIPNPLGATDTFCKLLTKIASGVGMFIASLGTIMIIVAGILYLISAGSPEKMTKAKTALIYAIVGIAIGISATVIVAIIKEMLGVAGADC